MEIRLFRELAIGQRFRQHHSPRYELEKIEPVLRPNGKSVLYNARYLHSDQLANIGHGRKCRLPPYEPVIKPPTTWAQLTPRVQAKGWRNVGELLEAFARGSIVIPRKPEE